MLDEWDHYITDENLCKSEGGTPQTGACQYKYKSNYQVQFNPGAKGPYTRSETCEPTIWKIKAIDPHGALAVGTTTTSYDVSLHTGAQPSTCVISVKLAK